MPFYTAYRDQADCRVLSGGSPLHTAASETENLLVVNILQRWHDPLDPLACGAEQIDVVLGQARIVPALQVWS